MTFEEFSGLMVADRSYRRFDGNVKIDKSILEKLVGLTRYCASGRNAQPLKYRLVCDESECAAIFQHLAWAGYFKDWDGPAAGERPTAYLVQCLDTTFGKDCLCDDGLQLQAITLGATTLGLGGCIIKSFNGLKISELLGIPENLVPRYVLALGKPAETVVIENMSEHNSDFKYWRDAEGIHHVPKRPLDEICL